MRHVEPILRWNAQGNDLLAFGFCDFCLFAGTVKRYIDGRSVIMFAIRQRSSPEFNTRNNGWVL